MNEEQKGKVERKIFIEFSTKANIPVEHNSIKKEFPPRPDISCSIIGKGKYWFELAEACAPEFKQAVSEGIKAFQRAEELGEPMPTPSAVWGEDVSVQTVQNKIKKKYPVNEPVDLLLYTNVGTAMTDDVLKAHLEPILVEGAGQFRRVWLLGDEAHQVWPVIS